MAKDAAGNGAASQSESEQISKTVPVDATIYAEK